MSCTDPPSASTLSQVSLVSIPTFLNTFLSSLFFLINVPLADCSVNTLAAQGSIPGDTLPDSFELDTVGAIALKCVLRIPVPTHHKGSPYTSARALEALSVSIFIFENISRVLNCAINPSKAIPFFCSKLCQPNTPNPSARPLTADLTEFSNPLRPFALCMNSSRTPSRNQVASYTRFVSFHSSYFSRLSDDKQQTKL